jgi:catechol 2,3-dioxygenase-like lactoylglutathione lyase family enzyme
MLKSILVVTIAVAQLGGIEKAYDEYLDYDTVERGQVSAATAAVWGAPASAGSEYLLMQPESGDPVFLRFVVAAPVDGYAPMTTFGWNAVELLAQDPDRVAARLTDSPFAIVGPPADLWAAPDAPRAMQAIGPGNELLYLTRNNEFEIRTFIDRVFIMVVGGPSMSALSDFYGDRMGLSVSDPTPFQISVLAKAQGVPPETTYPLAVARLSERFLLELDEYPDVAGPRPRLDGALPPGIAMVTFAVDDLDGFDVDWRASPASLPGRPYGGNRVAVTVGPAGEWLELVEVAAPASD